MSLGGERTNDSGGGNKCLWVRGGNKCLWDEMSLWGGEGGNVSGREEEGRVKVSGCEGVEGGMSLGEREGGEGKCLLGEGEKKKCLWG